MTFLMKLPKVRVILKPMVKKLPKEWVILNAHTTNGLVSSKNENKHQKRCMDTPKMVYAHNPTPKTVYGHTKTGVCTQLHTKKGV